MENIEFDEKTLTVGENTLIYNTMKDGEKGNIKTVIPNLKDKYVSNLQIIKGNLSIKTQDKKTMKIAQNIGIDVNPYDITEDGELLSSTGNLLLMGDDGTLVLPDSVKKIGYGAFSGVSGLKKIVIPESVTKIGAYAFANNTTLESVEIKGNLVSIGSYAFDGDTNLKNINLPDSISEIGSRAFRYTDLTEVTIPKKLKKIGLEIFGGCKLKKLVLQEGLEEISDNAFFNAEFESVKLPSTVSYISSLAFTSCNNLKDIDVSKNTKFTYSSGMLTDTTSKEIKFISSATLKNITEFEIPEGVTKFTTNISAYNNIKKLILPATLEVTFADCFSSNINEVEIKSGNQTLINNNKLLYNTSNELIMCYSKETDVTIPEGIKTINEYAFKQASNTKNIDFPHSLEKIGRRIISNSINIQNINIKENVTSIDALFKNQNYSGIVTISSENNKYEVNDNILYEKVNGKKERLVRVLFYINQTMAIDSEVKQIGDYAFYGQHGLSEISIPEGVITIKRSFTNCSNLLKVEIPSTVTSIYTDCFSDATNNLSQIIIKNKENSIPGAPWGAVKGLKVVTWKK